MARLTPDPTFYTSPAEAAAAAPETHAYVVTLNTGSNGDRAPDALTTIDLREGSSTYGQVTARLDMPGIGDELHHFGWNACSSALCPWAPHPHVERRYLLVPGLRSSDIHVVDVKGGAPKLVKTVGAGEIASKAGYSRPHTVHCGPDGIYVSALGNPEGDGPGGIFLLDHDDFSVRGAWETDRGPQELAYDFWWHLNYGTVITSEWGTPKMVEDGLVGELLLGNKYGHKLHVWDLKERRHVQEIDLGPEHQMVLELRPAHDPSKAYGFVGVVTSTADLSASVWLWERAADGTVSARKVITIPAQPADADQLPPLLQGFGAVPPLVTDISLSVDDRSLYVSCWGTGELKRYDVSDPRNPRETATVKLGGIVERAAHPASGPLNGGPQMVETSRDGKRVYLTNSLYASWDAQFYPEGIEGWFVKLDAGEDGSLTVDPDVFIPYSGERPHQVRLSGGDASSDSYCFPDR
ncbi:selenium-binding protein SBP56-related protein [Candidatus Solirubrobacter pratensis]|uniref:selenium-binding protein SBP56-related protein n=1 Tax=Candidatus Solirubrobacter pratensis TaxID=1298857 RepID=UPI000425F532|nr:selenium-binding protein SBP56-related protein [Candidatus Solirubrobacter pratensis]